MIQPVSADEPDDRRDETRHPIELKVEYKRLNAFFADYTKNISRGGTFIGTNKPLPIGTEFVFKLYVPNLEQALHIRGPVKWIVEPPTPQEADRTPAGVPQPAPGMGIRFIYKSAEERRHIEHLVERLMVDSLGQLVTHKLMAQGEPRKPDDGES